MRYFPAAITNDKKINVKLNLGKTIALLYQREELKCRIFIKPYNERKKIWNQWNRYKGIYMFEYNTFEGLLRSGRKNRRVVFSLPHKLPSHDTQNNNTTCIHRKSIISVTEELV